MYNEGKYLYCIIEDAYERNFGPLGIGGRGDDVHTLCYRDLACVISSTPMTKYEISRKNLIGHEKVVEKVMEDYTVLPFRFCTIATSIEEIRNLLMKRYQEFKNLLRSMDNKVELGLKVFWKDMDSIFKEIVESNQTIKSLRNKMIRNIKSYKVDEKANLGKTVKEALDAKKAEETEEIIDALRPICTDIRNNKAIGDKMVLNSAFLVDRLREIEFDDAVDNLTRKYDERYMLKYVGPAPPFNFVELVIRNGQE